MAKTKATDRGRPFKGGDGSRVQIRVDDDLRTEWQADADAAAGIDGAPLGPWIRAMVQRARGAFGGGRKAVRR